MFERKKYKQFAIQQLKNRWGIPVLITFITYLVIELFDIPSIRYVLKQSAFYDIIQNNYYSSAELMELISQLSLPTNLSMLITIFQEVVEKIFIVAGINVFLKMSRSPEKINLALFFDGLNDWWRATRAALWNLLWVTLWSFLFFIPGIVKQIAYSQMFYLISEYKTLSVTKAMEISKIITRGHKWHLFVMGLSFIGWGILCILTLGIGYLFLEPYARMSFINAYHGMLKDALDANLIRPEDLA